MAIEINTIEVKINLSPGNYELRETFIRPPGTNVMYGAASLSPNNGFVGTVDGISTTIICSQEHTRPISHRTLRCRFPIQKSISRLIFTLSDFYRFTGTVIES